MLFLITFKLINLKHIKSRNIKKTVIMLAKIMLNNDGKNIKNILNNNLHNKTHGADINSIIITSFK